MKIFWKGKFFGKFIKIYFLNFNFEEQKFPEKKEVKNMGKKEVIRNEKQISILSFFHSFFLSFGD